MHKFFSILLFFMIFFFEVTNTQGVLPIQSATIPDPVDQTTECILNRCEKGKPNSGKYGYEYVHIFRTYLLERFVTLAATKTSFRRLLKTEHELGRSL
jgi:hypothetical protein